MRIMGVGNAILDVFSFVDDEFPAAMGLHPRSHGHCRPERIEPLLAALPEPVHVSGGSAANTAKVAAMLGMETCFVGCVGSDSQGEAFSRDLGDSGVRLRLSHGQAPTGVAIVMRGRSGDKTLLVSVGAAAELDVGDLADEGIAWADWVYTEGFLLPREDLLLSLLNRAKLSGKRIAFDLGSAKVLAEYRTLAAEIVARYADIVFCNEEELEALSGMAFQEAMELFRPNGTILVVKRGAQGADYIEGDYNVHSKAMEVGLVDETGAGDAFAAGFLYGLAQGCHPERCLAWANMVAASSLGVPGSRIDPEQLRRLHV